MRLILNQPSLHSHPMRSPVLPRRHFLQTILASSIAPALVRGKGLNEKLDIAFIGCGGRGGANLSEITKTGENIVALCDVNQQNLDAAYKKNPGAQTFT